ncbi:hypothetical protein Tco_0677914 [Tanacetum coccineum]|uniref:Retrovirus-related Pol polyprotein from transposon TNT 1-94-like beta-barrel domain-containing protein n=1 Tax=Tanacetum coccineum TaxID=301880 RepID=A0ABQ4XEA6_9ASTR
MPKQSRMLAIFGNLDNEIKSLEKIVEEKLKVTSGIPFAYKTDRVEKSYYVSRPTHKSTNSKKSVLLNTKDRCTSKKSQKEESHIRKFSYMECLHPTLNVFKGQKQDVIQLVRWIIDSGCLKHMTGNLKLLKKFIEKFMGTIRLGNDHFAAITGYEDYVQGNLTICHNLEGNDLLTGSCASNLYTISISEMDASSPVCLMSKASSTNHELFGPLYHEYYEGKNQEVSNDFDAPDISNNEDTPSSSTIIVDENEALQIVSTLEEPKFPIINDISDELVQEDNTDLDGNTIINPFCSPILDEAESFSTNQDLSNIRLNTHAEMYMYALFVSTTEPKNIKEAMLDHNSSITLWNLYKSVTIYSRNLEKHGRDGCDSISTPMATTRLDADLQGTLTDQTKYRSMIMGLMYLTASRPDIEFATFVCAHYQA